MLRAMVSPPANMNRGSGEIDLTFIRCRERLARLAGAEDSSRVIFTSGATESLNLVFNGLNLFGKHVITTAAEHNGMLRPLWRLADHFGTRVTVLPVDQYGRLSLEDLRVSLTEDTALVCFSHASNVTGVIQPVEDCYKLCDSRGIPLLIDAAQSAGHVELNLAAMPRSIWVFTGHKALGGPQGTGGMVLGKQVELDVVKSGGSGVQSLSRTMPDTMPMRFEAGTPNGPGVAGLAKALRGFDEIPVKARAGHCRLLIAALEKRLRDLDGCRVVSVPAEENPCGILSFTLEGWTPRDLSFVLLESYGVQVRAGLHCAPLIHEALNTCPEGTVRISVSHQTTMEDIAQLADALAEIARSKPWR